MGPLSLNCGIFELCLIIRASEQGLMMIISLFMAAIAVILATDEEQLAHHFTPTMSSYPLVLNLSHLRYPTIPNSGLIDGSYFHCAPPAHWRPFYWNQKGCISMNCLFACNWLGGRALQLIASVVWCFAKRTYNSWRQIFPQRCRISNFPKLLTPYHGVQYHLAEWGCAQLRYKVILEFNPLINSE